MTQQERLTALFKEFGIEPMEGYSSGSWTFRGSYDNVYGTPDAYTEFVFDEAGKFKSLGVWE